MAFRRLFGRTIIDSTATEKSTASNPLYVTGFLSDITDRDVVHVAGQATLDTASWCALWPFATGGTDYDFPLDVGVTFYIKSTAAGDTSKRYLLRGLDGNFDEQEEIIVTNAANGTTPKASANTYSRFISLDQLSETVSGTVSVGNFAFSSVWGYIPTPFTSTRPTQAVYTIPNGYTGHLLDWSIAHHAASTDTNLAGVWVREFGETTFQHHDLTSITTHNGAPGRRVGDLKGTEIPAKADVVLRAYGDPGDPQLAIGRFIVALEPV